jgi:hypothetical protein
MAVPYKQGEESSDLKKQIRNTITSSANVI